MPTTAPKEKWRAVRRYALADEREKAQQLLQQMVADYPEDTEAADELRRLTHGQALHCIESQKMRRERLVYEAIEALDADIRKYGEKQLATSSTQELNALHRSLRQHLRSITANKIAAPPGTNAYKKALEHELSRRQKKTLKTRLTIALILLGLMLAVLGTMWGLFRRAEHLTAKLEEAWVAQDWQRTEALLETSDTGINRLMVDRLGGLLSKVRAWQKNCIARANDLSNRMEIYKKRKAISTLSLEERAAFLRLIRALPEYHARALLARWDEICRPEKEKLDMQRDAIVAGLKAAAALPQLSGKMLEDRALLKKAKIALEESISTFATAKDAFDLPASLIQTNEINLDKVNTYLNDIDALSLTENLLIKAYSYRQHYAAMQSLTPKLYGPALIAAQAAAQFASEEEINNEARAKRFNIPRNLPKEVIHAITDKGPTFCTAYPATLMQIHLMEDIFTSRTLSKKIYEVFRSADEVHYTEQYPTLTDHNSAIFTLSELDPARKVSKSPDIEWKNAHAVWTRTIDATPILKATGISRDRFFLVGNLPDTLSRITAINSKDCPALAKAYVYHTLLEVMRLHNKQPDICGLRFSPTMQEDIRSFRLTCAACKYPLTVTCWLSRSPAARDAEKTFEKWFAEHANRKYAEEMSRNLSQILRTHLRYVGYVDATGEPHIHGTAAEDATLWYISEGELVSSSRLGPLRNPTPYSPLFVE